MGQTKSQLSALGKGMPTPSEDASGPAVDFLRERLALFGFGGLLFVGLRLFVFILASPGSFYGIGHTLMEPGPNWMTVAAGLLFLSIGLLARYGLKDRHTLQFLDAAGLMAVCVVPPIIAWWMHFDAGTGVIAVLSSVLIVLWRAAVVPSHPLRTLILTGISLSASQAILYLASPAVTSDPLAIPLRASWLVVTTAIAAAASQVIYGLHLRARRAESMGQYRLEHMIGGGGMGEVYQAHHALMCRPVAIKLLRRGTTDSGAIQRFEREVRLTSSLKHPNTITIYDFGQTPDGRFFYAMELLSGLDLEKLRNAEGALPAARVIHLLRQVCGSLAEAHDKGLIHRDIKPANLILCEQGGIYDFVKVVDFGLIKDTGPGSGEPALTGDLSVLGTPLYISPEALTDSASIDGRSDLYSLGCVAWGLLTGRKLFDADSLFTICNHHLKTAPELPSSMPGVAVPADLEAVVMSCLAKDPDERPRDARDLEARLAACDAAGAWTQERARAWWGEHESDFETTPDPELEQSFLVDLAQSRERTFVLQKSLSAE